MMIIQEIHALLDRFEKAVAETDRNRRPGDGLLGVGHKPGDAPCNEAFDRSVAALFETLTPADTPPEVAAAAIEALFRADEGRHWPNYAQLTLLAAQRYALPLIPHLDPTEANRLRAWYEKKWPRFRRLPLQNTILNALRKTGTG